MIASSVGVGPIGPFQVEFTPAEIEHFVQRAQATLATGWLVPGSNNAEFERRFAGFVGATDAVAVSSGTAALEIAFRALRLSGSTVMMPTNTNYATAEAAIRAGCRPVLYDSGLYPELDSIEAAYTADVEALVVVHIGGYLAPTLPAIQAWCNRRGILLVEDASHAHGSRLNGRSAGTFGEVAAFSMFATKVLTTAEGGMVVTGDPAIAASGLRYRDQGKADDGLHNIVFGSAWRMSELHAALGVVQLDRLPAKLNRVAELVTRYVDCIDHPLIEVPREPGVQYSGHKFIVVVREGDLRESLRKHLHEQDVGCAKGVYEVPLHRQPILGLGAGERFLIADRFAASHVCLPMWPGLSDAGVDRVIDAINGWPVR